MALKIRREDWERKLDADDEDFLCLRLKVKGEERFDAGSGGDGAAPAVWQRGSWSSRRSSSSSSEGGSWSLL